MDEKLVLVTGVNSFIGSHVALQLLKAGYRVRGTARGKKFKQLKDSVHLTGLDFVEVENVATSDLTATLKDVFAIIHIASPLPGKDDVAGMVKSAEQGTTHVLEAAVKAGIEKVAVTSSVVTIMDPLLHGAFSGRKFNGTEWSDVTKEDVEKHGHDDFYVYSASKTFAERALWNFAKGHPQLDIATVLPSFVYGPYADHFPTPSNPDQMGTNRYIWQLITGSHPKPHPPVVVDVRDVAHAHVLALKVPRSSASDVGKKRYLLTSGLITWPEAARHLKKVRPQLQVADPETFEPYPKSISTYDVSRAEKDLGIKWIAPQDLVVAAADSLLDASKLWS